VSTRRRRQAARTACIDFTGMRHHPELQGACVVLRWYDSREVSARCSAMADAGGLLPRLEGLERNGPAGPGPGGFRPLPRAPVRV